MRAHSTLFRSIAAVPFVLMGALIAFGAPAGAAGVNQLPSLEVLESQSKLCTGPIAEAERRHGIPGQLMAAVAAAESGRWTPDREAVFAWPWTVTSGARSWLLPNKTMAVAQVRELQTQGITNIDVGCMQVNLGWHGKAFGSLEEAFDPETNIAYAASLLARLFDARRSWSLAVGLYHSATPALQNRYKRKVMALWNMTRRNAAEARRREVQARFEAARKARLAAQSRMRQTADGANQAAGEGPTGAAALPPAERVADNGGP